MSAEDKRAFCREWFTRGECPGCGAPLVDVAGEGIGHWLPGQTVLTKDGPKTSRLGEVYWTSGSAKVGDARRCRFTAEDLTSLVLIATDFGRDPASAATASPSDSSSLAGAADGAAPARALEAIDGAAL